MTARCQAALLALFATATATAQEPQENVSLFGKRYDAFRGMFAQRNLRLATQDEFRRVEAEDAANWIVVALGDVSNLPAPAAGWRRFVRSGGSLLIASDHGQVPVAEEFSVTFHPQPVLAPPGVKCYPDQRDCPLLRDFTAGSPLFQNIEVLALNRSGYLDVVASRSSTAARLPPGTTDAQGLDVGLRPVVYGAADGAGERPGRFLFAADHSLFINETMLNDEDEVLNAPFADNAVDWLIADRVQGGLKVLFLEDGRPIDEWIDPRYVTGEWPTSTLQEKLQTLDKLLRAINRMILEQQRRDPETGLTLYNQAVRNWESRQPPTTFLKAVLWGVAAFLMMTTASWLLGRRARPADQAPPPQADAKPNAPPPYGPRSEDDPARRSLLDRRRIEMLEEGHYVDLARRLSRVWLAQQMGAPPSGPPVEVAALRGAPARLRARWAEAWELAADAEHRPMSLVQFQRFRTDLANIQQLLDRRRRSTGASGLVLKENA